MDYIIENSRLKIGLKQKGAELCSIFDKAKNTELMWQADPAHWARHSCILFPIVGKLKEDAYFYQGKAYHLPQHGFARNLDFNLIERRNDALVFSLGSSSETLQQYPFPFLLKAVYELEATKIRIGYEVHNTGNAYMYFSIGAHPAFQTTPGRPYSLVFSEKETLSRHLLDANGLFSGEQRPVLDNQKTIDFSPELFREDALVFHQLQSETIELHDASGKPLLTFDLGGCPYLGLWSKSAESPFVCIEPWYGLADTAGHNQQLTEKAGIQCLAAGKYFRCSHAVSVPTL